MVNTHNQAKYLNVAQNSSVITQVVMPISHIIGSFLTTLKIYNISGSVCLALPIDGNIDFVEFEPVYEKLQSFCAQKQFVCKLVARKNGAPAYIEINSTLSV